MAIDRALRRWIRQRAENRCEYCGCHQDDLPFATLHVDHVISRQHGGTDDESNCSLACHWCNFHKGPNIATHVDGQLVPLFHPRQQKWDEHFAIERDQIIGVTPIGRGTVELLNMNDEDRREFRRAAAQEI